MHMWSLQVLFFKKMGSQSLAVCAFDVRIAVFFEYPVEAKDTAFIHNLHSLQKGVGIELFRKQYCKGWGVRSALIYGAVKVFRSYQCYAVLHGDMQHLKKYGHIRWKLRAQKILRCACTLNVMRPK